MSDSICSILLPISNSPETQLQFDECDPAVIARLKKEFDKGQEEGVQRWILSACQSALEVEKAAKTVEDCRSAQKKSEGSPA